MSNEFATLRASMQAEAELLLRTVHIRALASFDIVGRLNAVGAERVVQIGEPDDICGVRMFAIDEQNHGTFLAFGAYPGGSTGFYRFYWGMRRRHMLIKTIEAGLELGLRSWDLNGDCTSSAQFEVNEFFGIDRPKELPPAALDIPRRNTGWNTLKLQRLTPKEWWEPA